MKRETFIFLALSVLAMAGCTTTQQGTTIGGVTGAAIGGIVGHQSGHGVGGAAIGAAAGGLGGYMIGDKMEKKMFCPVCGRVYAEGTKYCSVDGTELKLQAK